MGKEMIWIPSELIMAKQNTTQQTDSTIYKTNFLYKWHTLAGYRIVNHSDVGAAPTTSSFST